MKENKKDIDVLETDHVYHGEMTLEEAMLFLVDYYHYREYWLDSNRTHSLEFWDCKDEDCLAFKSLLPARAGYLDPSSQIEN